MRLLVKNRLDFKSDFKYDEYVAGDDYVRGLLREMDTIHEKIRASIQVNSDRAKDRYDINARRKYIRTW